MAKRLPGWVLWSVVAGTGMAIFAAAIFGGFGLGYLAATAQRPPPMPPYLLPDLGQSMDVVIHRLGEPDTRTTQDALNDRYFAMYSYQFADHRLWVYFDADERVMEYTVKGAGGSLPADDLVALLRFLQRGYTWIPDGRDAFGGNLMRSDDDAMQIEVPGGREYLTVRRPR